MSGLRLLTPPECQQVLLQPRHDRMLREAVEWAVAVITEQGILCMVCSAPVENAAYAVVRLSDHPGWEICAGGICAVCGAAHPRDALLRHCEASQMLLFSQPSGHA